MSHQVGRRQQLDSRGDVLLFAGQRIFAKLGAVAYRRSPFFQKQRRRVVKHGADRKAGTDEGPRGARIKALMVKRQCALIGQLDGQRRNQRAGRERQQAGEQTLRNRQIKPDRSAQQRGGGCGQSQQGHHGKLVKHNHQSLDRFGPLAASVDFSDVIPGTNAVRSPVRSRPLARRLEEWCSLQCVRPSFETRSQARALLRMTSSRVLTCGQVRSVRIADCGRSAASAVSSSGNAHRGGW